MRLFVPGRVCLLGEHSDWAGAQRLAEPRIERGFALITGTSQGIHAEAGPHPAALVLRSALSDGTRQGPYLLSIEPEALLKEAERGGFWSYIAGVAYRMRALAPGVRGLVLDNFKTDLPIRKGLSSSAAMCVLTARAFNQVYALGLTVREEMELAYLGEITTPSRCGRMDQGCAFGARPVLMTFDGDRLETEALVPGGAFHFVIVDLGSRKNTTVILERLQRAFAAPESETGSGLRALLGATNRRIVHAAAAALRAGDAEGLGALLTEAQGLFDRYAVPACPEELTAPVLHAVLREERLSSHLWGGKGVGSQGDGAAQLLARGPAEQRAVADILKRELGLSSLPLTLEPAAPKTLDG